MKTLKAILIAALLLPFVAADSRATVMEDDYSAEYVCSGASTYTIDFPFLEKAHIVVTRWRTATPASVTTLVRDSTSSPSFMVVAINGGESGTVHLTWGTTCETDYTLRIVRALPVTQEISFRSQSGFYPKRHEYMADKLTMLIQQAEAGMSASTETLQAIETHIGSDDHATYFYLPGRTGGQVGYGGAAAGDDLVLSSTDHATKGDINIGAGTLFVDEVNGRVGVNDSTPSVALDITGSTTVTGDISVFTDMYLWGELYGSTAAGGDLEINSTTSATKGDIDIGAGTLFVDEANSRVGVGDATPSYDLDVGGDAYVQDDLWCAGEVYGSAVSAGDLTLSSTSHVTKGDVDIGGGTLFVDETNSYVGVNDSTPSVALDVTGAVAVSTDLTTYGDAYIWGEIYGSTGVGGDLQIRSTSNATKGNIDIGDGALDVSEVLAAVGVATAATATAALSVDGDIIAGDAVYGLTSADGDLLLRGTTNGTRTSSYVYFGDSTAHIKDDGDLVCADFVAGGTSVLTGTVSGGTGAGNDLVLNSTTNASKGQVIIASVLYADEVNARVGINDATPSYDFDVTGTARVTEDLIVGDDIFGGVLSGNGLALYSTSHVTKGVVNLADLVYVDEANSAVAVGTATASTSIMLTVNGSIIAGNTVYGDEVANGDLTLRGTTDVTRSLSSVIFGDGTAHISDGGSIVGHDISAGNILAVSAESWLLSTVYGSSSGGGDLVLRSTSNGTKGNILIGAGAVDIDETYATVGINTTALSGTALTVNGNIIAGDTIYGGTAVDADLVLSSTTNGDKDRIYLGSAKTSAFDEENIRLGIGTGAPLYTLHVVGAQYSTGNILSLGDIHSTDDIIGDAGIVGLYHRGGNSSGDDMRLYSNGYDNGDIFLGFSLISKYADATDRMFLGSVDSKYTARLNVINADNSDYAAYFGNENNSALAWGINIQAGLDTPSSNSDITWITFTDGDGGDHSVIEYTTSTPYARFAAASDARLKKNIEPTDVAGLAVVNAIPLRQFDWKDAARGPHQDIGYVAQEVDKIYPPMVSKPEGAMMRVGDAVLIPVLVKSIQELTAMLEALQDEVNELHLRQSCL